MRSGEATLDDVCIAPETGLSDDRRVGLDAVFSWRREQLSDLVSTSQFPVKAVTPHSRDTSVDPDTKDRCVLICINLSSNLDIWIKNRQSKLWEH